MIAARVEKTDEIERLVHEKAAKLDRLYDNLISCRVALERPQKAQRAGKRTASGST
jgi:ribosome-associated translation inhibitor RaiA